jgi:hypothetical protein
MWFAHVSSYKDDESYFIIDIHQFGLIALEIQA